MADEEQQDCKPYISESGELIVPCHCSDEYKWWAKGRSLGDILQELHASEAVWKRYLRDPYPKEKDS